MSMWPSAPPTKVMVCGVLDDMGRNHVYKVSLCHCCTARCAHQLSLLGLCS
uniref:Uncharacterized protein n=1 Tax=Arundo donax TaxID=35708 RepID=A0A0A9GN34_ARUDO